MALTFYTQPHKMIFTNHTTGSLTNAWSLAPNTLYDVWFYIQNDEAVAKFGVQVFVQHTPYGIGLPGTTNNITQPVTVNVPPKSGTNGIGLVTFQYLTPPGGHSCLSAQIMPNGPVLQQNTDVFNAAVGALSTISFLVFGGTISGPMILSLVETLESGTVVPPAQSWHPLFVPPPGTGPTNPSPSPVTLSLAANGFYSVGLRVTAAGNQTHVFHITGFVNGMNVGSVDLRVQPQPLSQPLYPCDPYIHGGYLSPDIILVDPHTGVPVPIGGFNSLIPDDDYGFKAIVHNSSPTDAGNTIVRFWEFPGGAGSAGHLVDIQTAMIPALSFVEVSSAHPFHSALAGQHKCAAVSIFNAMAVTCNTDAVTAVEVCDPNLHPDHSCSAWHNTNSVVVFIGQPWKLNIYVSLPPMPKIREPFPVDVDIFTYHVPQGYEKSAKLREIAAMLGEAGLSRLPLYLMPSVRNTMEPIDLKMTTRVAKDIKLEMIEPLRERAKSLVGSQSNLGKAFRLSLAEKPVPFTISGTVPEKAKPGDIIIVQVVANYPQTPVSPARAVEFYQIMHVQKG